MRFFFETGGKRKRLVFGSGAALFSFPRSFSVSYFSSPGG